MKTQKSLIEQLRGATRAAVDATRGVTDLVEAMHNTIGGGPAVLGRPLATVTKAVTAPVYGATRAVTSLVGAGLDAALARVPAELDAAGVDRHAVLAALNGVLGDYLAETDNPLAIEMELCGLDGPLSLSAEAIAGAFPAVTEPGRRLLVLVHGSSMDETAWQRNGHDHGAVLAREAGFTPVYLRYNSGLHISTNGRSFADRLEQLLQAWPEPIAEVALLGHSMGGLVARSACAMADEAGHQWRTRLRALVTLGTPHHGAPLERGGNWIQALLGVSRYSAPFVRLAELRSAGVTDLRYGNLLDEDWADGDRFARTGDPRTPVRLPAGVACYAIAASTSSGDSGRQLGDGLVPVDSALGRHSDPARALAFPADHQRVISGANHVDLLDSAEVCTQLVDWLRH